MKNELIHRAVQIPLGGAKKLEGDLHIPPSVKGIVLFAHGSGSSRFSPRNKYVAEVLRQSHLATLLMDLLTKEEETIDQQTAALRFDIDLLAERLQKATLWVQKDKDLQSFKIGYFGASTGAAAALIAASKMKNSVSAVVSRGGRPDLAGSYLSHVYAPTLLIVGGYDVDVIALNEKAYGLLPCKKKIEIVPKATHLFEEPGALESVAQLAATWFDEHLKQ